jgi:hypothetical protein
MHENPRRSGPLHPVCHAVGQRWIVIIPATQTFERLKIVFEIGTIETLSRIRLRATQEALLQGEE